MTQRKAPLARMHHLVRGLQSWPQTAVPSHLSLFNQRLNAQVAAMASHARSHTCDRPTRPTRSRATSTASSYYKPRSHASPHIAAWKANHLQPNGIPRPARGPGRGRKRAVLELSLYRVGSLGCVRLLSMERSSLFARSPLLQRKCVAVDVGRGDIRAEPGVLAAP